MDQLALTAEFFATDLGVHSSVPPVRDTTGREFLVWHHGTFGYAIELPGWKSSILGVLTAPSYRKTKWRRWGLRPPRFPVGFAEEGSHLDPPK